MPTDPTVIYVRKQGNSVFKFYVQDKNLIADIIRNGNIQQLPINIPLRFQTDLDEEKIARLKDMFEQCYFSVQAGKILVNARGLGGWGKDIHKGTIGVGGNGTWLWAEEVGFLPDEAKLIAEACNAVDTLWDPTDVGKWHRVWILGANVLANQSWHFNVFKDGEESFGGSYADTRIKHAKECLEYARECKNKEAALISLGFGLHALQDVFAHTDWFVSRGYDGLGKIGNWFRTPNVVYGHADDRGWYADDPTHKSDDDKKRKHRLMPGVFDIWDRYDPESSIAGEQDFNQRYSNTKTATYIYLLAFLYNDKFKDKTEKLIEKLQITERLNKSHNTKILLEENGEKIELSLFSLFNGFFSFIKDIDGYYTLLGSSTESPDAKGTTGKVTIRDNYPLLWREGLSAGFFYSQEHTVEEELKEHLKEDKCEVCKTLLEAATKKLTSEKDKKEFMPMMDMFKAFYEKHPDFLEGIPEASKKAQFELPQMKNQSFGISGKPHQGTHIKHPGFNFKPGEPCGVCPNCEPYGQARKIEALEAYKLARMNGERVDSPNWPFPNDGTYDWGPEKEWYGCTVHYMEGQEDKKWMAEKDKNFLSRLFYLHHLKKILPTTSLSFTGDTKGYVDALAVFPGQIIASGGTDQIIRIWKCFDKKLVIQQELRGHTGYIGSLKALSNGFLASGSGDHTIRIWDLKSGKNIKVLGGHTGNVVALEELGENKLASGAYDGTIKIWDLATGQCLKNLGNIKVNYIVDVVKLFPDKKRLIAGYVDGTVKIWCLTSGALVKELNEHIGEVYDIAVLSDDCIATASADSTVRIWNLKTDECEVLTGHKSIVRSLAVLQDYCFLVSASCDGTIILWDLNRRMEPQVLTGHAAQIYTLAKVSDDPALLVSGSQDHTIRLWCPETEEPPASLAPIAIPHHGADIELGQLPPSPMTTQAVDMAKTSPKLAARIKVAAPIVPAAGRGMVAPVVPKHTVGHCCHHHHHHHF